MPQSKPTDRKPTDRKPTATQRRRARRRRAPGDHPLSFEDQLRVAGIDPNGDPPDDIDEFRNQMARRIAIFVSNLDGCWRDCREPACRRTQSCHAPNIACSNAPPLPPDPDGRLQAKALAEMSRALQARLAQFEAEKG